MTRSPLSKNLCIQVMLKCLCLSKYRTYVSSFVESWQKRKEGWVRVLVVVVSDSRDRISDEKVKSDVCGRHRVMCIGIVRQMVRMHFGISLNGT